MKIHVLALEGVFDTGLSTVLDVFGTANELAELHNITSLRFETTVVAVRATVKTSMGMKVPATRASSVAAPDSVVVPAIGYKMPDPLVQALARPDTRDAGKVLRAWSESGALTASACIGTFVLAEAGLLNGHDATTTWWLSTLFRQRYPKVHLDESRIIVPSGNMLTAGAALSHLDMALWLVRQASPELAALTAKYLVVDSRPSQTVYMIPDHLAHSDPLIEKFERWARAHLAEGFSLDAAAKATATSKRTLARRMEQVLGKSPLAWFQDLRVEHAVHLLETSDLSVDQVATRVGYAEGVSLRTLLQRRLGKGVKELRRRQSGISNP